MTAVRQHLLLLATGLAAAVLVVAPGLAAGGAGALIGGDGSDAAKHVWSQWWVWHSLLETGRIPTETDLIFFPTGGGFFSLDTANALLSAPLRLVLSPSAVYNLLYALHIVLAVWAGGVLAARVLGPGRALAAPLAGLVFGVSAWTLAFALGCGVSETAFVFALPLALHGGLGLLGSRSWVPVLTTPLWLLVQAAGCWSFAVTASVGLALMGAGWLLTRPWRRAADDPWRLDRRKLVRLGLSVGVLALVLLPLWLAMRGSVEAGAAVYERQLGLFPSGPGPWLLPETNQVPLADFFLPGEAGLRVNIAGVERLQYAAYAGFVAIGLAVWGAVRGAPGARWALGAAVLFAALAMGPTLTLDHGRSWPGSYNPVHLAFYYAFPLFNATIHSTDRFVVGVQLCLGIAAAGGLSTLLAARTARVRGGLLAAAGALVVAEVLLVGSGPWPVPARPAGVWESSRVLAQETGGAVLDLPWMHAGSAQFRGEIFLQQTAHGRPVPFRLEGRDRDLLAPPILGNAYFRRLERALEGRSEGADCAGVSGLLELGFTDVVLTPDALDGRALEAVQRLLRDCLGDPDVYGEQHRYRLGGTE